MIPQGDDPDPPGGAGATPSAAPGPGLASSSADKHRAALLLLGSHFLTAWGWRTWEFSIALLLMAVSPDSMALVALYGLLDDLARVVSGPWVGAYLDRSPSRLRAASAMISAQHGLVLISATACAYLLDGGGGRAAARWGPGGWALAAIMVGAEALAGVGSMGTTVAVERTWAASLFDGDAEGLTLLNSRMRAVDLSCLLAAPLATGLLMTFAGKMWAVAALAGLAGLTWYPEIALLEAAEARVPQPGAQAGTLEQQEEVEKGEGGAGAGAGGTESLWLLAPPPSSPNLLHIPLLPAPKPRPPALALVPQGQLPGRSSARCSPGGAPTPARPWCSPPPPSLFCTSPSSPSACR